LPYSIAFTLSGYQFGEEVEMLFLSVILPDFKNSFMKKGIHLYKRGRQIPTGIKYKQFFYAHIFSSFYVQGM